MLYKFRQYIAGEFHYWGFLENEDGSHWNGPITDMHNGVPKYPSEQYLSPEFCEGDIVKLDDDWFAPIVKDGAGCFCLDLTGGHRIKNLVPITEHYFREVLSECEVSGNIRENGGLLP